MSETIEVSIVRQTIDVEVVNGGKGADGVDGTDGAAGVSVIPRTESEVTTALALLPAGSFVLSSVVTSDPTETEKPVVTAFVLGTPTLLTVPITTFTATDNIGVTGYLVNEVVTEPTLGDAGWSGTAQTEYTATSAGATTLYAWAKDASGNISLSLNEAVTMPGDVTAPANESVVIDEGEIISSLNVNLTLYATDDVLVTQMIISNVNTFDNVGDAWESYATAKAWTLASGADGVRNVYAKFRDAALNESGTATDTATYTVATFTPSDLWLASEEGDYWFNDPTTMFQLSGGTDAVDTNLDPVAFWAGQENGINFTQSYLNSKRPIYKNDSSDPRIYFDGAVEDAGTGLGCPRLFTDDEWTSLIRVRVNSQLTENAAHVIMAQATGNADTGRSSFAQLTYAATDKQNPTTFCNDGLSSFVSTSVVDVNDATYHTIIAHRTSGSQSTQVDSGSPEDVETPAAFTPVDSVVSLGGTQKTISQVIGYVGGNNTNMDVVGIIAIGRTLSTQELADAIAWLEAL